MYIETVPNRGSPPAILLRESYRDGKSIRKRTLLNLSHWPAERVEGLRGVLKGGVVIPAGQEAMTVERSLPHGHVAAVLGTACAGYLRKKEAPPKLNKASLCPTPAESSTTSLRVRSVPTKTTRRIACELL